MVVVSNHFLKWQDDDSSQILENAQNQEGSLLSLIHAFGELSNHNSSEFESK